jgi:hypothetical protein
VEVELKLESFACAQDSAASSRLRLGMEMEVKSALLGAVVGDERNEQREDEGQGDHGRRSFKHGDGVKSYAGFVTTAQLSLIRSF